MKDLHFGARMRRHERLKRWHLRVVTAAIVATLLGAPGMTAGEGLLPGLGYEPSSAHKDVETMNSAQGMMRMKRGIFDIRPTPRPAAGAGRGSSGATAVASSQTSAGSIVGIIYRAADEFGVGHSYLLSVAECESTLDPGAYNPAGYYGLFQFDRTTWSAYGYGSIYDPVAQARTAARLIAAGQTSRWPVCGG
jgi:soluble lytic murein transglycosylase-like protein